MAAAAAAAGRPPSACTRLPSITPPKGHERPSPASHTSATADVVARARLAATAPAVGGSGGAKPPLHLPKLGVVKPSSTSVETDPGPVSDSSAFMTPFEALVLRLGYYLERLEEAEQILANSPDLTLQIHAKNYLTIELIPAIDSLLLEPSTEDEEGVCVQKQLIEAKSRAEMLLSKIKIPEKDCDVSLGDTSYYAATKVLIIKSELFERSLAELLAMDIETKGDLKELGPLLARLQEELNTTVHNSLANLIDKEERNLLNCFDKSIGYSEFIIKASELSSSLRIILEHLDGIYRRRADGERLAFINLLLAKVYFPPEIEPTASSYTARGGAGGVSHATSFEERIPAYKENIGYFNTILDSIDKSLQKADTPPPIKQHAYYYLVNDMIPQLEQFTKLGNAELNELARAPLARAKTLLDKTGLQEGQSKESGRISHFLALRFAQKAKDLFEKNFKILQDCDAAARTGTSSIPAVYKIRFACIVSKIKDEIESDGKRNAVARLLSLCTNDMLNAFDKVEQNEFIRTAWEAFELAHRILSTYRTPDGDRLLGNTYLRKAPEIYAALHGRKKA